MLLRLLKNRFNLLEFALCGLSVKIYNTRPEDIARYGMEIFNAETRTGRTML